MVFDAAVVTFPNDTSYTKLKILSSRLTLVHPLLVYSASRHFYNEYFIVKDPNLDVIHLVGNGLLRCCESSMFKFVNKG